MKAFYPGPGIGGHCIPVDPFYLSWRAKQIGCQTRFIDLAGEINSAMPKLIVDNVVEAVESQGGGKKITEARIMISGIAFKRDIDDTRETPAVPIIDLLQSLQARLYFCAHHFCPKKKMVTFS